MPDYVVTEIAKKMLLKGIDVETIADVLAEKVEWVESLQNHNGVTYAECMANQKKARKTWKQDMAQRMLEAGFAAEEVARVFGKTVHWANAQRVQQEAS